MARIAQAHMENRTVIVEKDKLLEKLRYNKENHIGEYKEAVKGYRSTLMSNLEKAKITAEETLAKNYKKMESKISESSDKELEKFPEYVNLVSAIEFRNPVPKNYSKEYDSIINIIEWDTRKEIELTQPEFVCYIEDEWSWSSHFETIKMSYCG